MYQFLDFFRLKTGPETSGFVFLQEQPGQAPHYPVLFFDRPSVTQPVATIRG